MPKGEVVYIPDWVKNCYTLSPEDRKLVTVIEGISAIGYAVPPTVIIAGDKYMENWFYEEKQSGHELFALSATGYTNNELGIKWLHHFIKFSGIGVRTRPGPLSILLCDSYSSYNS